MAAPSPASPSHFLTHFLPPWGVSRAVTAWILLPAATAAPVT